MMPVAFVLLAMSPAQTAPEEPESARATGSWFGLRPWLDERGVTLEGYYTLDSSHVWRGRSPTGATAVRGLAELVTELDMNDLVGWRGGRFSCTFQWLHGVRGDRLVGDVQTFDNIDADPFIGMIELWLEQTFLDGRMRLKAGRIEANSEFASTETSPLPRSIRARRPFMHSSMGFSPTIQRFASYPEQSLGALVESKPVPWLRISGGAFDATLRPSLLSTRDPASDELPFVATQVIGEVELSWRTQAVVYGGNITVGGWGLFGKIACDEDCPSQPAGGPYAIFNQNLLREKGKADEGLSMFVQYGWSSPAHREIVHHAGAGVSWTGALPKRDADILGVGVTWVDIDDDTVPAFAAQGETAVEAFYWIVLASFMSLRPDLMVIVTPGGVHPDAVVGTLRLAIDL